MSLNDGIKLDIKVNKKLLYKNKMDIKKVDNFTLTKKGDELSQRFAKVMKFIEIDDYEAQEEKKNKKKKKNHL